MSRPLSIWPATLRLDQAAENAGHAVARAIRALPDDSTVVVTEGITHAEKWRNE
jgi:hypothetical protein